MFAYYLHKLDPIIFRIYDNVGPRWYGLAYVLAFVSSYFLFLWLSKRGYADLPPQRVSDFITGCALFGVIVGGRLGYVFFYKPEMLREPLSILRVWEGGMSSHGGMFGLLLFTLYYARRHKISWLNLGDNLVVTAPLGLFFGRCANFINGELYGRIANVPWAMQFPKELFDHPQEAERAVAACAQIDPSLTTPEAIIGAVRSQPEVANALRSILSPRHPSQLYEAFFEGMALFAILWFVRTRTRQPNGVLTGLFFICYAIFRIVIENFREPDAELIGAIHARPILFVFPDCDWRRIYRGGKEAPDVPEEANSHSEQSREIPWRNAKVVLRDPSTPLRCAQDDSAFRVAFPQNGVITNAGDSGMLVPEIVAAGGGLLFAFDHATIAGKIVLTLLAVVSIFSWSIMITKLRVIRFARRQNARFLAAFHKDRQPLRLFEKNARFPGAPVFNVYRAGCEEMTFHLLGSSEVDDTFRARLEIADKISPAQMGAVNAAMERAVGETALSLESQMILLATAVSGSPFLGLLGTVWGVMDAFVGVAEAGSPNLVAMAPGVSGALITTVVALCVAIPAMFGYNFLVTSIRGIIVEMDNFAAELASEFEHKYVDHGSRESAFRR